VKIHGITDTMIASAPSLSDVQAHLSKITEDNTRVVYVGHNVQIDLKVLKLYECHFIDTQDFYPVGLPRKLSLLSERELNARIQEGKHSSVIDCRAALGIFLANKADTRNQRYLSRDYLLIDKRALKNTIKANRKHIME
jgi:DNA polymerase III epsilon subunit-like protein